MRMMYIGALAAAIGVPASAHAQAAAEFNQTCYGATGNTERTIAACTAVIAGGSVDAKDQRGVQDPRQCVRRQRSI